MQVHLLFKGPSVGDLYFMQLKDCKSDDTFEEPRLIPLSIIDNNTASLFHTNWEVQSHNWTV
jgi:hypothetical protein